MSDKSKAAATTAEKLPASAGNVQGDERRFDASSKIERSASNSDGPEIGTATNADILAEMRADFGGEELPIEKYYRVMAGYVAITANAELAKKRQAELCFTEYRVAFSNDGPMIQARRGGKWYDYACCSSNADILKCFSCISSIPFASRLAALFLNLGNLIEEA